MNQLYYFIMDRIKLDDFLHYSYLSGLKVTEDGIFFILKKAKKDRTGYESNFYTLRSGSPRALTTDGKASFGVPYKGNFYFLRNRTGDETKNKEMSTIYSLPLDGGEASPLFDLNGNMTKFTPLDKETFLGIISSDMRLEGLESKEKTKKRKEIENYEEIEEVPFYLNGGGYINGRRERLAVVKKNSVRYIFPDDFNTSFYSLSADGTKLVVLGSVRKGPGIELTTEIRVVDLPAFSWHTALPEGIMSVSGAWILDGSLIAMGSDMKKYGVNENDNFYTIKNQKAELLAFWGESTWSSVGTDIRLGGGESRTTDGDWIYFTSTIGYSSNVYRINREGKIESIVDEVGSVDNIALYNGELYYIGLRGQKLQEIYSEKKGQLTHINRKVLRGKYVGVPERIEYDNDGNRLTGWLLRPMNWEEGKCYPAILDIHGGPKTVYGTVFMHEMQYWAGEGYFVFWTNPRGSDGYGNDWADIRGKYGTVDYSDLMKFTDVVLAKETTIDRERVGVTGGSYGGFMSNWILGHTERFKAIATQRSIYNWISFLTTSDIGPYFATDQCGCSFGDLEALYHRSPMEGILKNASTPTLVLHSDRDYRCPVEQAYQLYTTLVELGVETKFVLFHDETHELSRSGKPINRIKRLEEITKWMDKYLKK